MVAYIEGSEKVGRRLEEKDDVFTLTIYLKSDIF